jgi:hypothetical protein
VRRAERGVRRAEVRRAARLGMVSGNRLSMAERSSRAHGLFAKIAKARKLAKLHFHFDLACLA